MNRKKWYAPVSGGMRSCVTRMLAAAGCLFLLAGCGGVGPEERAYPLAIFIDAVPEGYQIIYDMADLSAMTGQNKQGDGGENGGDTGTVYTAGSLNEILEIYDKSSQYELDTGHVKAIVFGSSLLEQEDKIKEVLQWLEADSDLGRNALVVQTEQPSAIMEKRADLGDSVGVFLNGMYENREGGSRKELTLDDVFYRWNNYGELPEIPRIQPSEKGIELE